MNERLGRCGAHGAPDWTRVSNLALTLTPEQIDTVKEPKVKIVSMAQSISCFKKEMEDNDGDGGGN